MQIETETATHTPGPWSVGVVPENVPGVGHYYSFTVGTDESVRTAIADVIGGRMKKPGEAEANARLLAAAPDLLLALQIALPLAQKGYMWWQTYYAANPSDDASGKLDGLLAGIETMRESLAKAEGNA